MYNFIPGDGGYIIELYLTEKNGAPALLVQSIKYIPETLDWKTDPIPVNDGYDEDHWETFAITKSTLHTENLFERSGAKSKTNPAQAS